MFVFMTRVSGPRWGVRLSPESVLRNVGRRVAELRRERGLTQQNVADQLGISARYVQSVEAGRVNLSLRALVDWANLLRAPLRSLVEPSRSRAARRPGRPRSSDARKNSR